MQVDSAVNLRAFNATVRRKLHAGAWKDLHEYGVFKLRLGGKNFGSLPFSSNLLLYPSPSLSPAPLSLNPTG